MQPSGNLEGNSADQILLPAKLLQFEVMRGPNQGLGRGKMDFPANGKTVAPPLFLAAEVGLYPMHRCT